MNGIAVNGRLICNGDVGDLGDVCLVRTKKFSAITFT